MSEWRECKLGDICTDISYGYTASANSNDIGPKFLRITDIVPDRIDWSTVPYCEIDERKKEQYKLEIGDIVIARTGATTGYNKVIKEDIDSVFASYLIRYKIDKDQANPSYIGYCLQSPDWKGFVEGIIGGSAQPGANAKQFASFDISLPALEEQKIIAEVLSNLDDKIDLLHRQNRTLEELAQTLFRQWFLEEAKEEWEEKPLSTIAIHVKKNIKPSAIPDKYFLHFSLPAFDKGQRPTKELGNEILSNKYQVVSNSILVSKLNPRTPRIWLIDEAIDENVSICSTEFQVLNPIEKIWKGFIYCFLKTDQAIQELAGASSGTSGSHQRVKPEDIFNLTFQFPDLDTLQNFNSVTSDYWQKIHANQKQIQTLENLRDTLLPKLLSGEVKVQNA